MEILFSYQLSEFTECQLKLKPLPFLSVCSDAAPSPLFLIPFCLKPQSQQFLRFPTPGFLSWISDSQMLRGWMLVLLKSPNGLPQLSGVNEVASLVPLETENIAGTQVTV